MYRLLNFFLLVCVVLLFASCYAFLRADKLVYQGSMVKEPTHVSIDSTYNVVTE